MPLPDTLEILRDCRALSLQQLGALQQESGALSLFETAAARALRQNSGN